MPVIRGVGSVRQCFSEENYSVHKPFKEEAAYINMQPVFVNSCQLFTSTPRRYVPEPQDASLGDALHWSPPLVKLRALLRGLERTRLPSTTKRVLPFIPDTLTQESLLCEVEAQATGALL